MPRSLLLMALLGVALPAALAQPRDVHPVRSGPSALSLNGSWQFKYVAGSELGSDVVFSDPDLANTAAWPAITVPGHWELQGFAEPKYGRQLVEGTGLYVRHFQVPAGWSGQKVFLHFDGVLYGFEAWVNGTRVGSWASAYNPVAFDVTDALRPGGDNLLAVRVTTRSHGWAFDVNDCWALSGIYRDVTLFAVPDAHLTDFTAQTKLNPDGSASLTVNTFTTASGVSFAEITGRLLGPDGNPAADLHFSNDKGTVCSATVTLTHPQLWTAETPALYTLELALSSGSCSR